MRLSELGEFGLIDRIRQICEQSSDRVLLGIGDDAALFSARRGFSLILTTDALVEGVHFNLRYVPMQSLGWKSLAINLSDVAAMGGTPIGCTVSAAVPETWCIEDLEALYKGIAQCGHMHHCPVVGGDTVKSPKKCFISVTVLGEVREGFEKRRSGAKEEDLLCVTGQIGGARVGFEVLESGSKDKDGYSDSIVRFLEPVPRILEAQQIIRHFKVTSMIDVSDGLASEIRHLCEESHLGCIVHEDKIPIHSDVVEWAKNQGESSIRYAMESGEEYELLFTIDAIQFNKIIKSDRLEESCGFTVIGQMRNQDEGIQMQRGEEQFPMVFKGWDHYR